MSVKEYIYKPVGAVKTLVRSLRRKRNHGAEARIFLLNIPSHGNIGDHLISVAEQAFLKEYFPDRQVVPVTSADLFFSIRFALSDVRNQDILCVTGGGFMGSLYAEEKRFLTVISRFPDNKIVFFPQSFYYAPSEDRQRRIDRAARVFSAHRNLYVAARDSDSYSLLKNQLMPAAEGRISLVPDIAFFLRANFRHAREGVLFCIRNDAESLAANAPLLESLRTAVAGKGLLQRNTDTYVTRSIPVDMEAEEVSLKMDEFSKAQLVVTDRLHGMILAVITQTPVIVLDNSTGKVRRQYEMCLEDVPFVRFLDDAEQARQCIDAVLGARDCTYDREAVKQKYIPLYNAVKA